MAKRVSLQDRETRDLKQRENIEKEREMKNRQAASKAVRSFLSTNQTNNETDNQVNNETNNETIEEADINSINDSDIKSDA